MVALHSDKTLLLHRIGDGDIGLGGRVGQLATGDAGADGFPNLCWNAGSNGIDHRVAGAYSSTVLEPWVGLN